MKNHILKTIILSCICVLFSCKKEDSATSSKTKTGSTANTFSWKEDNGIEIIADSAYYTTGSWGTGIRAYKGGMANFFEINWATQNNISVGAKVLSASNFGFTFLKGRSSYSNTSDQNLNITSNDNNTITGNFNITVSGGSIANISGSFNTLKNK